MREAISLLNPEPTTQPKACATTHHEQKSSPSISLTLTLSGTHEAAFWRSPLYLNALRNLDAWSRSWQLFTNILFFRWQLQIHQHRSRMRLARTVFLVAESVCEMLWTKFSPRSYQRYRYHVLWTLKSVMFLSTCIAPFTTRNIIHMGGAQSFLAACTPHHLSLSPPLYDTLKSLLVVSWNAFLLFYSIIRPLPFRQQLSLHTIYMLILSILNYAPATHIISTFSSTLTPLCHNMNFLLLATPSLSAPDLPPAATRLNAQCDADAAPLLLLFSNFYVGMLLPAFISYRIELHLKRCYLIQIHTAQDELDAAEDVRETLSLPQPVDVLAPLLLIPPAWALSLWLQPLVARYALPL